MLCQVMRSLFLVGTRASLGHAEEDISEANKALKAAGMTGPPVTCFTACSDAGILIA
jgi:hypothetical protein